jgi:hypothetical protein
LSGRRRNKLLVILIYPSFFEKRPRRKKSGNIFLPVQDKEGKTRFIPNTILGKLLIKSRGEKGGQNAGRADQGNP